jgi:L-threonylcarbamoyladenylate synthase
MKSRKKLTNLLTATTKKNPETKLFHSSHETLAILGRGELAILPVDTLYGLAARCDTPASIEALFDLKGRDRDKPLSLVFRDTIQLQEWLQLSPPLLKLVDRLLPAPLTIILPGSKKLGAFYPDWAESVGVRICSACPASELLNSIPWPLALTSANLSGAPDPHRYEDISIEIFNAAQARINGHPHLLAPSTVVDLRASKAVILREGVISEASIISILEANCD